MTTIHICSNEDRETENDVKCEEVTIPNKHVTFIKDTNT